MALTETARLVVTYPSTLGSVSLRGSPAAGAALSWESDMAPSEREGDRSVFVVPIPLGSSHEVKLVRSDGRWATGRNLVVMAGDELSLRPSFEHEGGELGPWYEHPIPSRPPLRFRVLVPPSYHEQPDARYPVIYAQDAQALWSDHDDAFGEWDLDRVLAELWSLGAVEELIVVSIETSGRRLDWLSPTPDEHYGGGQAAAHLAAITEFLKPHIDHTLRTRPASKDTALLGSSMGGLFSFYAAWNRPDVFGSAMCLSSSFWWDHRWMIKHAECGTCPAPRPRLYLDSGAAHSPFEEDASARDGQHHTRAMERALVGHCYEPGGDLFVLTFPGERHQTSAWSSRVAIPLQLMFPRGDG